MHTLISPNLRQRLHHRIGGQPKGLENSTDRVRTTGFDQPEQQVLSAYKVVLQPGRLLLGVVEHILQVGRQIRTLSIHRTTHRRDTLQLPLDCEHHRIRTLVDLVDQGGNNSVLLPEQRHQQVPCIHLRMLVLPCKILGLDHGLPRLFGVAIEVDVHRFCHAIPVPIQMHRHPLGFEPHSIDIHPLPDTLPQLVPRVSIRIGPPAKGQFVPLNRIVSI
ncbi:MAG: hypothetical protein BWY82_00745 [Verrucomicrobia bacterium ADurb.Bin474]|nr:MAG: hypothetical protein BWY82_00745 [Verrucomicrobia bacterium ADurb.Bin474]